jgi:altronate dehydratase
VEKQATFQGYRRANGKVGTRNYIGILTSVNCSATVAASSPRKSSAPACSTTIPTSTASWR